MTCGGQLIAVIFALVVVAVEGVGRLHGQLRAAARLSMPTWLSMLRHLSMTRLSASRSSPLML